MEITKGNRHTAVYPFQNSFKNATEEKKISDIILKIKKELGIDIIVNGKWYFNDAQILFEIYRQL